MVDKVLSLLLVLCISMGILTSCSDKDEDDVQETVKIQKPSNADGEDGVPEHIYGVGRHDPFPGEDLGGITLRLDNLKSPAQHDESEQEMWSERLAAVEQKFNIKLEFLDLESEYGKNEAYEAIITSAVAGQPIADGGEWSRYALDDFVANDILIDLTETITDYGFPSNYYDTFTTFKGSIWGFNTSPATPDSILLYNRDMIRETGMEKTPGEMFKEGRWSYDDFFRYCTELKSKLSPDTYILGMVTEVFMRGFGGANGAPVFDTETYYPLFTSQAVYETLSFGQKLINSGIMRGGREIPHIYEDGSISTRLTFVGNGDGLNQPAEDGTRLVMAVVNPQEFDTYTPLFDWGIVPFPWGSQIAIQDDDYTTLSENYSACVRENNAWSFIKGTQNKCSPEQLINIIFSYLSDEGKLLVLNKVQASSGASSQLSFNTPLDAEIWDWFCTRGKLDPWQIIGYSYGISLEWMIQFNNILGSDLDSRTVLRPYLIQTVWAHLNYNLYDYTSVPSRILADVEKYALNHTWIGE